MVRTLNKAEKKLMKKEAKQIASLSKETKKKSMSIDNRIRKIVLEVCRRLKPAGVQKVYGEVQAQVKFPEVQKVKGRVEAKVKFPESQKVFGRVIAKVRFPKLQRIAGEVIAKVKFPRVQRIKGKVKAQVEFPETQKVEGRVGTDIPQLKIGKFNVIPVVLFNGKSIVAPDFGQTVVGNGKIYAAIQELSNLTRTQSHFYTGQVRITASGNAKALGGSTDIKTVVVQALKDNVDTIYITAGEDQDYELQPGQPVTIVIDNLDKINIVGSYKNDGVCFLAS